MRKYAIALLLLAPSLWAATYYVSPTGTDSGPGTDPASPWHTIYYATRSRGAYLQSGDTLILRGGSYSGNGNSIDLGNGIGNSGTQVNPITVQAYPGETPIVCDTTTGYRGVLIKNKSWWVFDGITYSNCYQPVWMESCTNFVFKNCAFGWMTDESQSYAGVQVIGDSQLNTITNCTFMRWGMVDSGCGDHGVSLSIGNETLDNPMWYNLIVNCRFFYGGHDNLQLNSAYNVIRGNLFVNAPWFPTNATCNVLHRGGYPDEPNMYGAYGNRNTKPGDSGTSKIDMRNVFENNTFLYTGPPPDDGGADNIHIGTAHSIYRFNVFAYALRGGIDLLSVSATSAGQSNVVYGNTIYRNGQAMVYGGELFKDVIGGITTEHAAASNNFIVNNIVWDNYETNIHPNTWTYQHVRTNWDGDIAGLGYPQFISTNGWGYVYDPSNLPDFHLRFTSPCIDKGDWLTTITSDSGSGTTFTVDNSLYFSDGNRIVPGDTIQLQGQTARAVITANDWTNNILTFTPSLTWTNGQGVSLSYTGTAPDMGAYEFFESAPITFSTVTIGN